MGNYQQRFSKLLKNVKSDMDNKVVENALYEGVGKYWQDKLSIDASVGEQAIELSWVEPRIPVLPRGDIHTYNIFGKANWCNLYINEFHKIIQSSEVLVFVPWLKVGGADKVAKLQIDAFCEQYQTVTIVATDGAVNYSKNNVKVVELFKYNDLVPGDSILIALAQTIVSGRVKRLHIANSGTGYKLVNKYGVAIRQNTVISINTFCNDRDALGLPVGYLNQVSGIKDSVAKIFTDNKFTKKILINDLQVPSSKIFEARIPVDIPMAMPMVLKKNYSIKKVIWASRLDVQKAPLDLVQIAAKNKNIQFDLYGDFVLSGSSYVERIHEQISKVSNVKLMGGFKNISEINFDDALFLYTSHWDGMPNMLIEVASMGVPVVAYPLGGIKSEFSSDEFSYASELTPDALSATMLQLIGQNKLAINKAIKARKKILSYHTIDYFLSKNLEFFK